MPQKHRLQMQEDLTRFELQGLLDDPDLLEEMVDFFHRGGFTTYSISDLERQHEIIFNNNG